METGAFEKVIPKKFQVASFIGSGINGNIKAIGETYSGASFFVASFIGSGINGN